MPYITMRQRRKRRGKKMHPPAELKGGIRMDQCGLENVQNYTSCICLPMHGYYFPTRSICRVFSNTVVPVLLSQVATLQFPSNSPPSQPVQSSSSHGPHNVTCTNANTSFCTKMFLYCTHDRYDTVILLSQSNNVCFVSAILHTVTREHIFPDFSHKSLITLKFSDFSRLSRVDGCPSHPVGLMFRIFLFGHFRCSAFSGVVD